MRWSPSQPNGWWPKLSPSGSRLLYGNGHTFVALLNRLVELLDADGRPTGLWGCPELDIADGWHYGWLDNDTLLYGVGNQAPEDTATQHRVRFTGDLYVDELTGADQRLAAGNTLDANDGHWCTYLGVDDRIAYDNRVLATPGGGAKTVEGRVAWACNLAPKGAPEDWGLRLYDSRDGQIVDIRPPAPVNGMILGPDGYLSIGYWGPTYLRGPEGLWSDLTMTPWKAEGAPVLARGPGGAIWAWSGTVDPYDQRPFIFGHPLGDATCLVIPDLPFVYMSVRLVGDQWRIAGCGDRGQLTLLDVPAAAQRHVLTDKRPPMPLPVIEFAIDRETVEAGGKVISTVTRRDNVATHRFMLDGKNAPTPNDRDAYTYTLATEGDHTVDLKAQGLPADALHRPWDGGAAPIILSGVRHVLVTPAPPPKPPDPPVPTAEKRRGLQLGFGWPLDPNLLTRARSWGWDLARLDCLPNHLCPPRLAEYTAAYEDQYGPAAHDEAMRRLIAELVDEVVRADFRPVPIIIANQMPLCPPIDVEVYSFKPDTSEQGLEPDTAGHDPFKVADEVNRYAEAFFARGGMVWVGCISNPSKPGQTYLGRLLSRVDKRCGATFHRYPGDTGDPPWLRRKDSGQRNRTAETQRILDIAQGRPVAMSEGAAATRQTWTTGWWRWKQTHRLSEAQIAEYEAWASDHYAAMKLAWWVKYQVGGDAGIVDNAGQPLPVADARAHYVGLVPAR